VPIRVNIHLSAAWHVQVCDALRRARDYLYSRQSDDGGFCFYRSEYVDEPNLGDTYHAVAALKLLKADVPRRNALVQFLEQASLFGPTYLHLYAFTLDLLGQADRIEPARFARLDEWIVSPRCDLGDMDFSGWLRRLLFLLRLKRRFSHLDGRRYPFIVDYILSRKADGGFGHKPNIEATWLCLSILALLGEVYSSADTRSFVDNLQIPSIGFTGTRDSLSANLDVLHAGVRCCALLGLPVRYREDALGFVLCCQTPGGGFSRAPVALPDVELTHRALKIIACLAPELMNETEA